MIDDGVLSELMAKHSRAMQELQLTNDELARRLPGGVSSRALVEMLEVAVERAHTCVLAGQAILDQLFAWGVR